MDEENKKLREIILYLIQNLQIKTNANKLTYSEKELYKKLINKKLFKLTKSQKLKSKRLLQKIRNPAKLKEAIAYIENLEKRYNRFLKLDQKIKILIVERDYLKSILNEEYKKIKMRQIKTNTDYSDPLDDFKNMHLEYIIYNLKEEFNNEI